MKSTQNSLRTADQHLRTGSVLAPNAGPDVLEMTGDDRHRFLNGQVTCDVSTLEPGAGTYGFFTTGKGQIQADVTVLALEDRFWLFLPPGLGGEIKERLEKYKIVDRVEIEALEGWSRRTLAGPESAETVRRQWGVEATPEAWSHGAFELKDLGVEGRWVREGRRGVDAITLWVPAGEKGIASIDTAAHEAGLLSAPLEVLEALRIEAGEPRFGIDFGAQNLPQETGIEEAVSYTKGCYLGQEVVARLHYRGQVSRRICGVEFIGAESTSSAAQAGFEWRPPEVDTPLELEGRAAGHLKSATYSPQLEKGIGLAMLQRRAFEPGTRLSLPGGAEVEVRALPFVTSAV